MDWEGSVGEEPRREAEERRSPWAWVWFGSGSGVKPPDGVTRLVLSHIRAVGWMIYGRIVLGHRGQLESVTACSQGYSGNMKPIQKTVFTWLEKS